MAALGTSVLVRPFCGGVAPPILLSAPPTEVQISILHHQALLYLITMKPHDINTQPTNHIVSTFIYFIIYLKVWVAPPNMKILARTLLGTVVPTCMSMYVHVNPLFIDTSHQIYSRLM